MGGSDGSRRGKRFVNEPTVLMTTSPIPLHPDMSYIEQSMASVREQLPDARVIILADGVRPEQEHLRPAYDEYVLRLTLKLPDWSAELYQSPVWVHQANLIRVGVEMTTTSTVAFVEHDSVLTGEIPWGRLVETIESKQAHCIRLVGFHEIPWYWAHLMCDDKNREVNGLPLRRTYQWSCQPHIASTEIYRKICETYFAPESRSFIESVMWSVVANAWVERGDKGWDPWRLWIYAPPDDMRRCFPLPGRGDEGPLPQRFVYPEDTRPAGAPAPT